MAANEKQVGGSHYQTKDGYQHWDFVDDVNMPYFMAQATRYMSRWTKKNGREDLEKALHYVQKQKELFVKRKEAYLERCSYFIKVNNSSATEKLIFDLATTYAAGNYDALQGMEDAIKSILASTEEPLFRVPRDEWKTN